MKAECAHSDLFHFSWDIVWDWLTIPSLLLMYQLLTLGSKQWVGEVQWIWSQGIKLHCKFGHTNLTLDFSQQRLFSLEISNWLTLFMKWSKCVKHGHALTLRRGFQSRDTESSSCFRLSADMPFRGSSPITTTETTIIVWFLVDNTNNFSSSTTNLNRYTNHAIFS